MKTYKFKAKIEAGDGGGAYVLVPYDTEAEFATRGKVPVKAAPRRHFIRWFAHDLWRSTSHARRGEGDSGANRQETRRQN
jgi:hypothetical protein